MSIYYNFTLNLLINTRKLKSPCADTAMQIFYDWELKSVSVGRKPIHYSTVHWWIECNSINFDQHYDNHLPSQSIEYFRVQTAGSEGQKFVPLNWHPPSSIPLQNVEINTFPQSEWNWNWISEVRYLKTINPPKITVKPAMELVGGGEIYNDMIPC